MSVSVVIMAAGLGTRMKSSTPKVLHKISNHPMLYHIINEAKKISDDIQVVLYHQSEKVKDVMSGYFDDVKFVLQEHLVFPGTGGALMSAKPKHERVLVLNGDMPLVTCSELQELLKNDEIVVLSAFKTQNPTGYGRVIINNTLHVEKIVEEKDASDDEKKVDLVNAGVYLFDGKFLKESLPKLTNQNAQKEYYATDLIKIAFTQNEKIKAVVVDEQSFMGINSKHHLDTAEQIMQGRIKSYWMEQGVIMRLSNTIFIDSQAKFIGECELQNGVNIFGSCTIENSLIKANSTIENSVIVNSEVGPLARIRPDSKIINSKIGNFVEVKKSTLNGVKAGHLSYLGDAVIDEGTNVGCGTITCNYDGKSKHKTVIGKNVFIGSDVQLVAPVKIDDNVIIGAGTTVTKDVPTGTLAISRSPLKFIDGFFSKFFGK